MKYDVRTQYLPTGEVFTLYRGIELLMLANALAERARILHEADCKALRIEPKNTYYVHFNPKA
jgi:hypothetical protein